VGGGEGGWGNPLGLTPGLTVNTGLGLTRVLPRKWGRVGWVGGWEPSRVNPRFNDKLGANPGFNPRGATAVDFKEIQITGSPPIVYTHSTNAEHRANLFSFFS